MRSPTLERLTAFAAGRRPLEDRGAQDVLGPAVAVVDHEQAAAVEPVALESIDDARERIELAEDDGDLVGEEPLAVVQEGREDAREVFGADFAPFVFVLSDV